LFSIWNATQKAALAALLNGINTDVGSSGVSAVANGFSECLTLSLLPLGEQMNQTVQNIQSTGGDPSSNATKGMLLYMFSMVGWGN
jgi:hypothetical protein